MNASFHVTLSALRKERKITQKQAAADLGISQALLSHYEKGIRECGLDFLVRAADYYKVTTDYLLGRQVTYTQKENSLPPVENLSPFEQQQRQYICSAKLLLKILHRCEKTPVAKTSLNIMCCWLYFGIRYLFATLPGDSAMRTPSGTDMIQNVNMTLAQFSLLSQAIAETDPKQLPDVSDEKILSQFPELYDGFREFIANMEKLEKAHRTAQISALADL